MAGMFKLVAVYALLVIAFAFDLGELDEGTYESLLREQGFSEEDIQQFVEVYSFLNQYIGIIIESPKKSVEW